MFYLFENAFPLVPRSDTCRLDSRFSAEEEESGAPAEESGAPAEERTRQGASEARHPGHPPPPPPERARVGLAGLPTIPLTPERKRGNRVATGEASVQVTERSASRAPEGAGAR